MGPPGMTPAEAPRFWGGVASAEHVARGVEDGSCQLPHGKAGPVGRLRPGDGIACYAPRERMGEGEPVQAFVAIGTIAEGEPDQGIMDGFVAARREVRWWPAAHRAPIRPHLDRLFFAAGRAGWGTVLRRGSFPVTGQDFRLIAAAMGAEAP